MLCLHATSRPICVDKLNNNQFEINSINCTDILIYFERTSLIFIALF